VPLATLFMLQLTAFFFNVVIPGNIGGDLVKAFYVARDQPNERRTTILLLAFVERLLGVSALVLVGMLVAVLRGPTLWHDALLRPLATVVVGLGAAVLVGGGLGLIVVRRVGDKLARLVSGPSRLAKLLSQVVASMRLLSAGPAALLSALGLSMAAHAASMTFFMLLTHSLVGQLSYAAVATVFPLGLLSLLLPLSPAGLGVGHVAFQRLFEAIGLEGGATVFNVYLLGQIAPCLLGVFPFLSLKRRGELPQEALPDGALRRPRAHAAGDRKS
jgi:uncharacterized protein (TIRG00374 family)